MNKPVEQDAPAVKLTEQGAQADKQVVVDRIISSEPAVKATSASTASRGGVKIIHKKTGLVGVAQPQSLPAWEQRGWTAVDDK